MRRRALRLLVLLAVAVPLFAERKLTAVTPPDGFPYGGNLVTLAGEELSDFVHCTDACQKPPVCPVSVLFGTTPGTVLQATDQRVLVYSPEHAPGTVDVTLRVDGRPDLKLEDAFTFKTEGLSSVNRHVRYLVPIVADGVEGAHGSLWTSDLTLLNASDADLVVQGVECSSAQCPPLAPGESRHVEAAPGPAAAGIDGAFIWVPEPLNEDVQMELRVRDVSREAEGWGTELPLVRDLEFRHAVRLLDVPTDPRYRATLRIYAADDVRVLIRISKPYIDEVIAEYSRQLMRPPQISNFAPRYVQFDPLTTAVRTAAGGQQVRVEVFVDMPNTFPAPAIWAFVSITNNDTQQVTAITPHRD